MNKKLLLAAILLIAPLTSCNDGTIDIGDKILTFKAESIDAPVLIETLEDLNNIVRHDDVILYVYQSGCSDCENLEAEISDYIETTNNIIYQVSITLYKEAYESDENKTGSYAYLYPRLIGTPSLLFYRDGTLKNAVVDGISVGSFASTVERYVIDFPYYSLNTFKRRGNRYYLWQEDEDGDDYFSTSVLDDFCQQNDEATILFTWRGCSDCSEFSDYVLEPFLYQSDKKIYYFETDNFFLARRSDDEELAERGEENWKDLTSRYHLDDYLAGVTPTMLHYSSTGYELSVFRNDQGYQRYDDGTIGYVTTFYEEVSELRSETIVDDGDTSSSTYQKAIKELREKAFDVEKELCTGFLNEHL